MIRHARGVALLFLWGLVAVIGGAVVYNPLNSAGIAGGLRWLTVAVALFIGGSLIVSGVFVWRGGREYARQMQTPALGIVGIGVLSLGESVLITRPWAFAGLAGGLRMAALVGFIVGGGSFVVIGLYCYQTHNPRIPLMLFAGITGAGAFYPLDKAGILIDSHPFLWVAFVLLFVSGPILSVFYGWPNLFNTGTVPDR